MRVEVSLDRVTISGDFRITSSRRIELRQLGFDEQFVGNNMGFVLRRWYGEEYQNVAYFMPAPYQANKWRIDTSNHLQGNERTQVSGIVRLLVNAHLTRVDIAFDFIDGPFPVMKHKILRPRASQSEFGVFMNGNREIQTVYSGRRNSERLIRMYNKFVEQKKHGHLKQDGTVWVDEYGSEVSDHWERWEVQLRRGRSYDWVREAEEMLSCIRMPVMDSLGLSWRDKAIVLALASGQVTFAEMGREARSKYRKLIKEFGSLAGYDDTYARVGFSRFKEEQARIENELYGFLQDLNIREED